MNAPIVTTPREYSVTTTEPVVSRPVTVRGVTLGAGRPKTIVPLVARTAAELAVQASVARAAGPDLVEWRMDHLVGGIDGRVDGGAVVGAGRALVDTLQGIPLLVTIRTAAEGGQAHLTDADYLALYAAVLDAGLADLLDVEIMHPAARDAIAGAHAASVPVVASHHDFRGTPPPDELVQRLELMAAQSADVLKVAVMPRDPGDVLALLAATWTARQRLRQPLITMSMAAAGVISRLGGGVFGSAATFATVGAASAPGQVDLAAMRRVLELVHPED